MKAFRHPITLAFIAEGFFLLLEYLFPWNVNDGFLASPRFWIGCTHFPALILSTTVFHAESELAKTLAMVVPTLILWILFFYAVRLGWSHWSTRHARF